MWTLLFGPEAGDSTLFGSQWLIGGGMLTMAFGAVGMLGSQRLGNLAGFSAILSSGTLLAAVGFGQNLLTGGLLYYMLSSTLAVSALFLLADLIDRWRNDGSNLAPYEQTDDAPFLSADLVPTEGMNLDDKEEALIGQVIPAAAAFLGLAFMACTLIIAGLPPLPGFVGKFAMIHALLNPLGLGSSNGFQLGAAGWMLMALLVGSGLLALISLTRSGIRHFWAAHDRSSPKLLVLEGLPIAMLLVACAALAWQGGAVMRYTQATADALYAPATYVRAVMQAEPVPNPPHPGTPESITGGSLR
jgi:multicomponent K+:H+ antiporter subunit D